ncbi:uncharacterized protein KRP23_12856 [Phytophthora ramorum]|uniref:uncharacterized protein n=1 Tax=Phytophthora ramorum TaxID=164328 RepID=UPI0030B593B0|nr:hypothetical protein KRP23_12856 [Phytophthora ramorum]
MATRTSLLSALLVTVATASSDAASTARVVVPDLAGMIYPSTSVSQHVQFGDPSSSFPTAYELVASTTTSVTCVDAQLCLELQISSVFDMDPFFLHRYDTNTPLVSATFEGYDAKDILPLIPGRTDGEPTVWWFQSNATDSPTGSAAGPSTTSAPPAIDLLLRLRQRSQRLSARDQLLVQLHFQSVDSRTATSAIQVYSVYGSQRVTHTTRRVDANTIRVALSITRNTEKSDVSSSDVYPLAATTLPDSTSDATSCDACGDFLDACQDIEACQSVVLPCLISQLETMAGSSGSTLLASPGSDVAEHYSTEQVDLIGPLAVCAAALPTTSWVPIRQAILCLARLKCALGLVPGEQPGEQYPTLFRMSTNGAQTFVVTPTTSETNNVNLTIVVRDIRPSVNEQQTFAYSASASYLDMFLRSFVLQQAAEVSALVEAEANDPSRLQISLIYSNALMLKSVAFNTAAGSVDMIEDVPARAVIEYPASSSRPALDTILARSSLDARLTLSLINCAATTP